MALIDTDKNGLGADSHREPGSAEVLLGSSLLEQHPTALIETPLQGGGALPNPRHQLRIYQEKVAIRLQAMENNLEGDVKRLTNHTPEFRMRAGNYRALFEIEGKKIVVYRILHRKEVYR